MPSLPQEAARELFLLLAGVRTTRDIVSWADSLIEQEDKPTETLIELSTAPLDRIDRFIELLSNLKGEVDCWPAIRAGLAEMYRYLKLRPEEAEHVGTRLRIASAFAGDRLPSDLNFFHRFEDAFTLAREEHYGTIKGVTTEPLTELEPFANAQQDIKPNDKSAATRYHPDKMKKALIEGLFSGGRLVDLRFNREGLERLKAALARIEKEGVSQVEDDAQGGVQLVLDESMVIGEKAPGWRSPALMIAYVVVYLGLAALVVLGILHVYELFQR